MNYNYYPDDVKINNLIAMFDFDNQGLVQFYHRNIAYLIIVYVIIFGFVIFKKATKKLFKPYFILSFFLFLQVVLGIVTLLSGLNIFLASAHQICSLLLILSVINLYYKYIK